MTNPQSSNAPARGSDAGNPEPGASPWSPLRQAVFRSIWIALVVSNIGTWMQSVGAAWLKFQLYTIRRVDFLPLQNSTFEIAIQYQRSVYDSSYLALAKSLDLWFFTGDKRLFNAVGDGLDWVKWIGDYEFDMIPNPEVTAEGDEA